MYKTSITFCRPERQVIKFLITMKLVIILLTATFLQASALGYAQKVTINVKNASIEQVLEEIQQQTGYDFLFNAASLKGTQPVDLAFRDASLKTVLDACFANQPLTYQLENTLVLIRRKNNIKQTSREDQAIAPQQQQREISGKVSDEQGMPVAGVTVKVKDTQTLTTTDNEGIYHIGITTDQAVLVFSTIGFSTEERMVSSNLTVDVVLKTLVSDLDEVVVIGYGSEKKRDVTGAIVSIKSTDIEKRNPIDVFEAIQGKTPGVEVTSNSGAPGDESTVRIRGTATFDSGVNPLYIVDGAPIEDISGINPNDIESIEILKDAASAAIYGSRSANGVILITTKKGILGTPKFDVRYLQSFKQMAHMIPQSNATERRIQSPTGVTEIDSLNPAYSSDNYYQDLLSRTAVRNQVDLSVRGANEGMSYYGSLGYLNDEGIILNSYAKTIRSRFNVDFKLSKKSTFGNRIQLSYQTGNRINEGSVLLQGLLRPAQYRIYLPDGSLAGLVQARSNPVAWAQTYINRNSLYQANIYNYFNYQIADYLKFTVDATVNGRYNENFIFSPKVLSSVENNSANDRRDFDTYLQSQGYLNYNQTLASDHTLTGVLGVSVDKDTRKYIRLSATDFLTEAIETFNAAQLFNQNNTLTFASRNASLSAFGRVGYSYKGKYIFNSNVRADGSSRFGKDKRWGFFPSVSAAWRISDEPFMAFSNDYLNDAKFRVSYGLTGNDRIGDYDAIQRYSFGQYYYDGVSGVVPNTLFGNNTLGWETTKQFNLGVDLSFFNNRLSIVADYYDKLTTDLLYSAPLPDESGYSSVKVNVGSIKNKGFEFGINSIPVQKNDFTWAVDYNMSFNKTSVTELYNGISMIPASGTTTWWVEEGQQLGNFYGWNSLGVYQYDESNAYTPNWEQLDPIFDAAGEFVEYRYNGQAYNGEVQKMKGSGIILKGGDVNWEDLNKDGLIDDADRQILGNAQPLFTAGLNNSFAYKNFTFSFGIYTSWGGKLFNYARYYLNSYKSSTVTPQPDIIRSRWKKQGDVSIYPRSGNYAYNQREISSIYVEDASFIRLRNAKLSYELPQELYSKLKVNGFSVYAYGNNLLTWTNYRWFDPEISPGSPLTMGKDSGRYPRNREIGFGVNINF